MRKWRLCCLSAAALFLFAAIGAWVLQLQHLAPSGGGVASVLRLQPRPRSCRERLFVFGVTYEPNHGRARVAQQTWARDFSPTGIPWYSNASDAELHARVLVPSRGMGYLDITWRMMEIWTDVLTRHPGYDWYMRVWDDNYVHFERVCALLEAYNPAALLELGHVYTGHVRRDFAPHMDHMIGGGAASLTSRASNEALLRHMADCAAWIQDLPPRTPSGATCRWNCEDYYQSYCRLRLGTRLVEVPGFFSHSPSRSGWSDRDLAWHAPGGCRARWGQQPHCRRANHPALPVCPGNGARA